MSYIVIILAVLCGVQLLLLGRAVKRMRDQDWEIRGLQKCLEVEVNVNGKPEVGP